MAGIYKEWKICRITYIRRLILIIYGAQSSCMPCLYIYIYIIYITLIIPTNTHTHIYLYAPLLHGAYILKKWTYIINSMIKNYYKVKLLKLSGTVKFSSCERSGMSAGGGCLQQSCRRTQGLASPLFRLSRETRGRRTVLRRRISTQTANLAQPDK